MSYLLAQFWFPASVSLLLGVAIGWLSVRDAPTRWWSGWVPWAVAFVIVGLALAVAGILPGRLGLWLELSLLLFVAYLAGCFAGGAVRMVIAPPARALQAEPASSVVETTEIETPDTVPATSKDEIVSEMLPGTKPVGRDAPRDGKADDLRRIKGIGRQNALRLNELGIWHFYQIAAWTPREAEWIGAYLAFPGRIEREDWIGQAKLLARGEDTEFSRRVDSGEVETSSDSPTSQVKKRAPRKPRSKPPA